VKRKNGIDKNGKRYFQLMSCN